MKVDRLSGSPLPGWMTVHVGKYRVHTDGKKFFVRNSEGNLLPKRGNAKIAADLARQHLATLSLQT